MKITENTFKRSLPLLIAMVVCSLLPSCDGIETSNNGDLDGMWHLVKMDSLDIQKTIDYKHEGIFWSVQNDLLQVDDKQVRYRSCLLRFEKKSETLRVFDPYLYNRDDGDELVDNNAFLTPFGINALNETFSIEKLNRNRMILKSQLLRLYFSKY